jgi:hypothetical protein
VLGQVPDTPLACGGVYLPEDAYGYVVLNAPRDRGVRVEIGIASFLVLGQQPATTGGWDGMSIVVRTVQQDLDAECIVPAIRLVDALRTRGQVTPTR